MIARDSNWQADCRTAKAALDRAIEGGHHEHDQDLVDALRALVKLRDGLIGDRGEAARQRLETVNAILSVAAGGEYPLVGVNPDCVKQARGLLDDLFT